MLKIFGSGSRAPIAVSLLVKNPDSKEAGKIFFHDVGDYLTREEKLLRVSELASVAGIESKQGWGKITPDEHGDWLKQRDASFDDFLIIGEKRCADVTLFSNYSCGVQTNRDAWVFNFSKVSMIQTMKEMIDFYNKEVIRFKGVHGELDRNRRLSAALEFIDTDPAKISWSSSLIPDLANGRNGLFDAKKVIQSIYRPFSKQWLYFDGMFNHRQYQMSHIFSDGLADNKIICITGRGESVSFSVLMTNLVSELKFHYNSQCFPLYLYGDTPKTSEQPQSGLFDAPTCPTRQRRDAITDEGLAHFQEAYPDEDISKEDLFYYVYGLLHSPDYRERYADNLSKELPRIPRVKTAADFWAFSQAGRDLAHWHLNYETVTPYPVTLQTNGKPLAPIDYRVEKMKYGKNGKEKDRTTLHYNERITLTGIPLEAYDYVVNGKPALDWVVERQCVKVDKDSGIVNDANDWALETMKNPRYPLELFQRVITVSLETIKIVKGLPPLDI